MSSAGYWAAAFVIIGIVFMVIFRSSIRELLARTKKVSKDGLEAYPSHQNEAPATENQGLAAFNENFVNPLLVKFEESIRSDMETRRLTEAEDAISALVRSLAANQMINGFLRISSTIYAGQVDYLMFLNTQIGPISKDAGLPFFNAACERNKILAEISSLESWYEYFKIWDLVKVDGDNCEITLIGREYLKWRIEEGVIRPVFG